MVTHATEVEYNIYGSSRLGTLQDTISYNLSTPSPYGQFINKRNLRSYELSNHLGNVLATINDYKTFDATTQKYSAQALSAQHYYPYGMVMPNKSITKEKILYKHGFGGHIKENEVYGKNNFYDFGGYGYNPLTVQRPAPDPLQAKYPSLSPYNGIGNNPILYVDPDGRKIVLFDQKSNKVATITKAGTIIEKGMENSAILKSYVETKDYFKGTSAEADFTDFENDSKVLNIRETSNPEGAANFKSSGFINIRGIDANGSKKIEAEEVTSADYKSATDFGTIEWNPLTGGIDAEGNKHSPAMIFAHELKHAKHFKDNLIKYLKDISTKKIGVNNVEEENAINETNMLSKEKNNGDGGNGVDKKRTTHEAEGLFPAKSTTSNQAATVK